MAKREKIVVWEYTDGWVWEYDSSNATTVCRSISSWPKDRPSALRSARAFAAKFKHPPDVVVEEA